MKMDETAKAIARMREEAKAAKSDDVERGPNDASKPQPAHANTHTGRSMSNAAANSVQTKRQKSG